MNLAQSLSSYFSLNLMVMIAFMSLKLFHFLLPFFAKTLSSASELKIHYSVLGTLIGIIFLQPLMPKAEIFQPSIKLWSAESIRSFPSQYNAPDTGGYIQVPFQQGVLDAQNISNILLWLAILVLSVGLFRVIKDFILLKKIRKNSFPIRKIGKITIFINDTLRVPFSYWSPGKKHVVIPSYLVAKPSDYRMAISHELQHHRQGDTKWIYVLWLLRILCACNPFAFLWSHRILELQEFACDETLVDQNKVESQQYARCLIEVAETASRSNHYPVCAIGLVFLTERQLLKRRIQKMLQTKPINKSRSIAIPIGFCTAILMASVAYASNSLVQDRRVTLNEARDMAANIEEAEFPIVVNEQVLKQLNRYIGTPEGREFMRRSLERLEIYRTLVESNLEKYEVPHVLIALPIIESGYQNLEQKPLKGWGAGLWMFIQSTARNFGLRVDNSVDERLNPQLITDAAMRLLKSEALRFRDWQLAVMAYNMGGDRVQEGIKSTGSRDAWKIINAGFENDKDYLAKLIAAILIMNNPESVN